MENVTVEITDQNDGCKAILTITTEGESMTLNIKWEPEVHMHESTALYQGLVLHLVQYLSTP